MSHDWPRSFTLASSTEHHVFGILAELTGSEIVRLDPDLQLYDLGLLDSLRTVELLLILSDKLGIDIAPSEIDRDEWATPRGIVEVVNRKSGA